MLYTIIDIYIYIYILFFMKLQPYILRFELAFFIFCEILLFNKNLFGSIFVNKNICKFIFGFFETETDIIL